MRISLIVAMAENGVIGRNGDLPWKLSADLRRFKRITMGHHLIMGRKTFESIGRLLPGRTTVVVTRQAEYTAAEGAVVVNSLEAAIDAAKSDDEVFVIGGGEIYRAALPRVDRIYLTRIDGHVDGDTHFAELADVDWRVLEEEYLPADEKNEYGHRFQILERQ